MTLGVWLSFFNLTKPAVTKMYPATLQSPAALVLVAFCIILELACVCLMVVIVHGGEWHFLCYSLVVPQVIRPRGILLG